MSTTKRLNLYSKFERFNHWVQAGLIITLILTGFEMHGTWSLFGFEKSFTIHNWCAWAWLTLFIFDAFYLMVTGEWRQFQPTFRKLRDVIRYYLVGIFRGEPHPVPKSERAKHNPLQRLAYLSIVMILVPFQMITGFLYYYYNDWAAIGLGGVELSTMALLHTIGAFGILAFIIVHVYMTTTGHTIFSHLGAMITGYEEVEDHGQETKEQAPSS
ncbi:MAG: cytochrome B [Desulfovibrio sp.]|nr:MAG: cytochrome B [Desulfovibrio sp.]